MSSMHDTVSTDLSDLIQVFDHELRTPLSALRGHLELIEDRLSDLPVDVVRSLEVMNRAVARLEAAVDGVGWLEQTTVELRSVG